MIEAAPFDSPIMSLLDGSRLILALLGIVVGAYQVMLIRRAHTRGQQARFLALAILLGVVSVSRVQLLGAPITWQYVASAFGIGLAAYGSWAARSERPAEQRPPKPHHR